ncbi:MAG: hypothetical protein ACE5ID_10575, partial [Acidobacteriota bacterium]
GEPEVFAGIRRRPGLRNSNRLNSLFNRPASLAIQQATGPLYVADAANHAIRTIDFESGVDTDVATLAGGQPGVRDGGLDEARFRNPAA